MNSDFFLNHDEVNSDETIGAAISDLFREKQAAEKLCRSVWPQGAVLSRKGRGEGGRRRQRDRTRGILFNRKKETTRP